MRAEQDVLGPMLSLQFSLNRFSPSVTLYKTHWMTSSGLEQRTRLWGRSSTLKQQHNKANLEVRQGFISILKRQMLQKGKYLRVPNCCEI